MPEESSAQPSVPPPGLFRPSELERLSSPEQLDRLMRIADPKGWIALAAIAGVTFLVISWSIFGSIATTVRGQGVLIREAGGFHVTSPVAGQVVVVNVTSDGLVEPGRVVARIDQPGTGLVTVRSPFRERVSVVEVLIKEGDYVTPGEPIISVDKIGAPLRAVLYLPAARGQQVHPGMFAAVYPVSVSREQYGFIRGRVRSVAGVPSTVQGMTALLGNATLVQALFNASGGTPLQVEIDLERADTPSEVAWSSSRGPATPLRVWTLSAVDITLGVQRPMSLIFPATK